MSQVHAQARTTPRTRAEIKDSTDTVVDLADRLYAVLCGKRRSHFAEAGVNG